MYLWVHWVYAPPLCLLVLSQRPTVLHFEALAVWSHGSRICRALRWRCGVNVALVVRAALAAIAGLPSRADSGGSAVDLLGSWQEHRAASWPAWVPKAVTQQIGLAKEGRSRRAFATLWQELGFRPHHPPAQPHETDARQRQRSQRHPLLKRPRSTPPAGGTAPCWVQDVTFSRFNRLVSVGFQSRYQAHPRLCLH